MGWWHRPSWQAKLSHPGAKTRRRRARDVQIETSPAFLRLSGKWVEAAEAGNSFVGLILCLGGGTLLPVHHSCLAPKQAGRLEIPSSRFWFRPAWWRGEPFQGLGRVTSFRHSRFCRSTSLTRSDLNGSFRLSARGRTGFDHVNTPEAACRGRCVGLVNHRIKQNS